MITHIVFDVDGTLTDGGITVSDNGVELKTFQAKDGIVVRMLPRLGFTTMIITGRNSNLTNIRAEDLDISITLQGINDKADTLKSYISEHKLSSEHFAYVGDDLNDYAAMKLCAFKACPLDAADEVRLLCDYVSIKPGGRGAVRDICEYLLRRENKYTELLKIFSVDF